MFNFILKAKTLQEQIFRGFLAMGLLVFLVAMIGLFNNRNLATQLDTYSDNAFPSVDALWRINEAQTQIQSAERLLLNLDITKEEKLKEGKLQEGRRIEIKKINQ